jgi:flagellar biosynthesis/type III secretory pathway chaperone
MPLIQQLIDIVEELLNEHENLLKIEERKKRVLIDGDMEALQEITNQEIRFIRQAEKLEQQRMKLGEQVAKAYGMKMEELTASKLANLVKDPQQAAKINLLTGKFVKVIGELKQANELNGVLLKQSWEFVQRSIDLIMDVPDSGTYTGKGDTGQAAAGQRRFFDTQA